MLTETILLAIREAAITAAKRDATAHRETKEIDPNGAFYNWRNLARDRDRFVVNATEFSTLYATFVEAYLAERGFVKALP